MSCLVLRIYTTHTSLNGCLPIRSMKSMWLLCVFERLERCPNMALRLTRLFLSSLLFLNNKKPPWLILHYRFGLAKIFVELFESRFYSFLQEVAGLCHVCRFRLCHRIDGFWSIIRVFRCHWFGVVRIISVYVCSFTHLKWIFDVFFLLRFRCCCCRFSPSVSTHQSRHTRTRTWFVSTRNSRTSGAHTSRHPIWRQREEEKNR